MEEWKSSLPDTCALCLKAVGKKTRCNRKGTAGVNISNLLVFEFLEPSMNISK